MCLHRPLERVARPPCVLVVLVVARDLDAGLEPRLADEERHPARRGDQRFHLEPLGLDAPLLVQLTCERAGGLLARVDRATGAERPLTGPARHPRRSRAPGRADPRPPAARRPASQRPSWSRTRHIRLSAQEASSLTSRSA